MQDRTNEDQKGSPDPHPGTVRIQSDAVSGTGRSVYSPRLQALLARPAIHVVAGLGILLLDYWTGPFLMFPILFVLPIVLAAWFCGARLAYALAVFLPAGRLLIAELVDQPQRLVANMVNALIRITVLLLLAYLVARTARLQKEIRVLRGLLRMCMVCRRIYDEGSGWQKLETYILEHSEATFTHGLCPECAQEHYREYLGKKGRA